nr:RHS domain-containing protein [Delftia sp. UME58]
MPLAKLESEWRNEENRNAQAEADKASFATNYYHCDQIGAPQELTDEAGRIVWAASYYKGLGSDPAVAVSAHRHGRCSGVHPRPAPAGPGRAG